METRIPLNQMVCNLHPYSCFLSIVYNMYMWHVWQLLPMCVGYTLWACQQCNAVLQIQVCRYKDFPPICTQYFTEISLLELVTYHFKSCNNCLITRFCTLQLRITICDTVYSTENYLLNSLNLSTAMTTHPHKYVHTYLVDSFLY